MVAPSTTAFPTGLDTAVVNPVGGDFLSNNNVEHDLLHDILMDAVRAIELKVGITSSPDTGSLDYKMAHHQHLATDGSAKLAAIELNPALSTDYVFGSTVASESFKRFRIRGDGRHEWGPGSGATDTFLDRTGVGVLTLTGGLTITGALGLSAPLPIASGGTGSATKNFVDLTTAQTVAGVKTFSSAPVFSAPLAIASGGTGSATQNFVDLTNSQTIAGVKTFSSAPVFSVPLAVGSGGTGSATQNFVDLSTAQASIGGAKTFTALLKGTAGIDVQGSPSGYTGGELRFPLTTSGASSALSTMATGSPAMAFDHRATSNTGSWTWNNGTGAATNRMALSSVGVLTVAGGVVVTAGGLTVTAGGLDMNSTNITNVLDPSSAQHAATKNYVDTAPIALNTQTASYTAVLGDAGKVVEMNVASANTFTIPPNSSVAFPIGTIMEVFQLGAGQTTITAGAGVTFRSDGAKTKTAAQYATATVRKRATDEWVLAGDLV